MENFNEKIPINDIIKSLFDISINNKEKRMKLLHSDYNSTKAIEILKDKEINILVAHENIMSNFSKAQRLLEVYSGSIDSEYKKKYISNIKWYKNFKNFRQEYLYTFSTIDNLRNEFILRELVTNNKFLENYNTVLRKKGLKVIIVDNKKLENPKYNKFVNNLMPFITTIFDEKKIKKDNDNIKITIENIMELDDESIEKIFLGENVENFIKNIGKIERNYEVSKNEDNEEKKKENNKNNKFNFMINMHDLKDIFLFGVIDEGLPKFPSRREIDRRKKILNRSNIMKLINNSIVVNFTGEKNLKIIENKLVIDNRKKAIVSLYLDEEEIEKNNEPINLKEKLIETGNNFTNLLYNLDLETDIVVTIDRKDTLIKKNIYYFVLNELQKSKYTFNSKADVNILFNFIKEKTDTENKDNEMLIFNKIFKEINDFFNNNRDIFRLSTIDFIIGYIHVFFASFVALNYKIDDFNNYVFNKINELKEIFKVSEHKEFIKILELFSEYQANEDKNDIFQVLLAKNKKNKNSFLKQKVMKFEKLFRQIEKINDIFLPLFQEYPDFFKQIKNYSLYNYITFINNTKEKQKNNLIEEYLYNFFISFIVENYLVYPTEKNKMKKLQYKINNNLLKEEDQNELVIKNKKETSFKNYVGYKIKEMIKYLNELEIIKKNLNMKEYKLLEIKKQLEEKEKINFMPKSDFINFSYSIFNLKNYIELAENNITKEINILLNKIPNASFNEIKKITKKYLIDNKIAEEGFIQEEWLDKNLYETLKSNSMFELRLNKKIKNEVKTEIYYFKNIYEIFTFVYLQTLILFKELYPILNENLNYYVKKDNISFEILFHKEEDLKKVLNVIEFVKFIISHYKLAKKTDNIFSYKYNQIDTIMNECLQSDLASLKNINSPDIDVARKKIIEYSNNPLSFFHYNFQGEEIKIINTERFNFKVYNLFLLNSINYEKLRELFQITKLEFDKNGNTVLGMILSKDLIFETEDKKELDRSKLEYLILDNSLDIYKYPNNNSKEYLKVLNFKEENPNNYLAVTEFIKANKTVYNLEIFIKLNIKEI